jgi:phosphoglucosamine mutase
MESLLGAMKPKAVSKIDGMKLDFKNGWLLVRPSGTEPKVRLTAEAKTEKAARELYAKGLEAVKKSLVLGKGAG